MFDASSISKRTWTVFSLTCTIVFLVRWHYDSFGIPEKYLDFHGSTEHDDLSLANATLGFSHLTAISSEDESSPLAWRIAGLRGASNRTGIEMGVAPRRDATVKELHRVQQGGEGKHPKEGSALAWIAHVDNLRRFVDNNGTEETLMAFEDDVDWDVDIRKHLAPSGPIAAAIRNITGSKHQDDIQSYPFGLEWDVLWLGHCGFEVLDGHSKIAFEDQSILLPEQMKGMLGRNVYANLRPHTRELYTRIAGLCTFAYGVTQEGARKLISIGEKGGQGFDFSTHVACKAGFLRCVGVMPELFHQMKAVGGNMKSSISESNAAAGLDWGNSGLAEGGTEDPSEEVRYFTFNVPYSARCNADRDDSPEERVQCLPNKRDWENYQV